MKWKFSRTHYMTPKGREDFGVIHDEKDETNVVCYFGKGTSDIEGRMIANAPQMYELIKELIESEAFRRPTDQKKSVDLMKKITE